MWGARGRHAGDARCWCPRQARAALPAVPLGQLGLGEAADHGALLEALRAHQLAGSGGVLGQQRVHVVQSNVVDCATAALLPGLRGGAWLVLVLVLVCWWVEGPLPMPPDCLPHRLRHLHHWPGQGLS